MTTTQVLPLPTSDERPAPTFPTVAAVCLAALVVVGQLYAVLPLMNALAGKFGTSPTTAAWASTTFGFAYAVGMLVAGPLSDAVGRRRVAVAGLLAGAVATALVGILDKAAHLVGRCPGRTGDSACRPGPCFLDKF